MILWHVCCKRYTASAFIAFLSLLADEVDVLEASMFGDPSGPIFIDEVQCSGFESNIFGCDFSKTHMCTHSQDVGIICHGRQFHSISYLPFMAELFKLLLAANDCEIDNAGCDHFCTETIRSYTCSCYPGYTLQEDKHTCVGELLLTIPLESNSIQVSLH